jgi:hypothetical protein
MAVRDWMLAGAVAAAAALPGSPALAAEILQNGSFTSDTSGWLQTGRQGAMVDQPATVISDVQFHDPDGDLMGPTYLPADADPFFAVLNATGDPEPTTFYQGFHLEDAAAFTGSAAFLARDELPYNDFAWVRLYNGIFTTPTFDLNGPYVAQVFFSDVATLGGFGATPWTPFSLALGPGDYTIVAHAANGFPAGGLPDFAAGSQLALDGFSVQTVVPEPATWAMLIGGFFALGLMLRRRRAAIA